MLMRSDSNPSSGRGNICQTGHYKKLCVQNYFLTNIVGKDPVISLRINSEKLHTKI